MVSGMTRLRLWLARLLLPTGWFAIEVNEGPLGVIPKGWTRQLPPPDWISYDKHGRGIGHWPMPDINKPAHTEFLDDA